MRRSRFVGATLATAFSCGVANAASRLPRATPSPQSSPGNPIARIDALLQAQVARRSTAAVTVAVGSAGRPYYTQGYGQAQLEPALAATPATRYRIGSVTKQFTAASILLLAEAGKLAVDDRLERYLPEYVHASALTLRQLLNQSSGIPPNVTFAFADLFAATTPAQVIAKLNEHPLGFTPGAKFENAHPNYYLLGVVLERIAGLSYARFVQERIAGPLGLNDTFLDGTRADVPIAAAYNAIDGRLIAVKPWSVDYLFSDGGLISTAADLLTWNAALRGGRLLKPASWELMTTVPHLPEPTTYAMGLVVNTEGNALRRWHNGRAGGAHAMNAQYHDPDRSGDHAVDYDVVVLANTNGAAGIVPETLANIIIGIVAPDCPFALKPEAVPPPAFHPADVPLLVE